jgi:hypothetical protein
MEIAKTAHKYVDDCRVFAVSKCFARIIHKGSAVTADMLLQQTCVRRASTRASGSCEIPHIRTSSLGHGALRPKLRARIPVLEELFQFFANNCSRSSTIRLAILF